MGFNNHAQRSTPPYYLNIDNPFEGISYKRSNIHKRKQQHIEAQADGIDNEDITKM